MLHRVILKTGREKSVLRRHPWIFSGAVNRVDGSPEPGATVDVVTDSGKPLGRGAWSPDSQIVVRMWTFNPEEPVDEALFERRIDDALQIRKNWHMMNPAGACRIIAAESDGLPGLVVDRYRDYLVCQFTSRGVEAWKPVILDVLTRRIGCSGIYERSDTEPRSKENLPLIRRCAWGSEPPETIEFDEGDLRFTVDVRHGHKTGFYLDQQINRARVKLACAGADVLNCFAYTGGFGIAALIGGARHVTHIEDVAAWIDTIRRHGELNGCDPDRQDVIKGDAFEVLRRYDREGRSFDAIVLDPPKFVEARSHLIRGCRGYKDINRLALKLLRPGGSLFTFSCSGIVSPELFRKVIADAAVDARCDAHVVDMLMQSPDHPVMILIPETLYLKGLHLVKTPVSTRGDHSPPETAR
ncbi:class I SAM-dependent methyltransferase [bacterium]|nr:class I SAM-dependent methyltransferase [candidate division CSSED10-310 bacterium]